MKQLAPFTAQPAASTVAMPVMVRVIFAALVVSVLVAASNFTVAVAKSATEAHWFAIPVVLVAAFLAFAVYFLGFRSMRRGWLVTAPLLTVLGLWSLSTLFYGVDVLSILDAVAGILVGVSVWTPSARGYNSEVAAARRGQRATAFVSR